MDEYYFYQNIKHKDEKVSKACDKLLSLYKKIPDTKGCLENIGGGKQCGAFCCLTQTPQFLYVEFLHAWRYVLKNSSLDEIENFIENSIKNYIVGFTTKGCIFFDSKTKLCPIHEARPYNCYIYGITSEEEFHPRYEKMKEQYKEVVGAVIKDQCKLVSIINDKIITQEDTNKWWNILIEIENFIGVKKENINDDVGGSYRTPHDHLLLYIMPDDILEKLQAVRLSEDKNKYLCVSMFMEEFRKRLKNVSKQKN